MLTIKTPAKINWSLSVLKKRPDGYHDIISLIQAIDLYDTLIFEESEEIEIICNAPIKLENNLVYKSVKALQEYTGIKKGVKITLKKEIPIGAGLAGGSSDVSATLKTLNELWGLNLNSQELQKLGTSLGSDVSFFFHLPICIIEGRGEIIKPLKIQKSYNLLLVKPPFGISTKWAYDSIEIKSQLTENYEKINNNTWQLYELICKGVIDSFYLWNDLEKPVIKRYPEIDRLKKRLLKVGAVVSLMSGSGSTVFGLFKSKEEALSAAERFNGYWVKVVQTLVS
ncbi:MAG: 4-(cytidine 5'-diphospho)-2-C-methyl-D-erythritol kinase [Thermodesulfovibrio sp.]|nr:4-(cytidine 5'-diphospho)-2-C-methyl-D-erythritol kinase [Thermodesulfovibrio sp.]